MKLIGELANSEFQQSQQTRRKITSHHALVPTDSKLYFFLAIHSIQLERLFFFRLASRRSRERRIISCSRRKLSKEEGDPENEIQLSRLEWGSNGIPFHLSTSVIFNFISPLKLCSSPFFAINARNHFETFLSNFIHGIRISYLMINASHL